MSYQTDKEVAKFMTKVIVAFSTEEHEKLAGFINDEIFSDCSYENFCKVVDGLSKLASSVGLPTVLDFFENPSLIDKIARDDDDDDDDRKPSKKRSVLGTILTVMPLLPVAAHGLNYFKEKGLARKVKQEIISSSSLLKEHKSQAEKFFDTIVSYAPALLKAPYVIQNILTSWINMGQSMVTHKNIEDLLKLQGEYSSHSPMSKASRTMDYLKSVGRIAKDIIGSR